MPRLPVAPAIDNDDFLICLDRHDEANQDHVELRIFLQPSIWSVYLEMRDRVLAEHIRYAPGTRVSFFWHEENADGHEYHVRKSVGGFGVPFEDSYLMKGIPCDWLELDVRGALFESQATYLKRNDLLLPGELERIPAGAFEPVCVVPDDSHRVLKPNATRMKRNPWKHR